MGMTDAGRRQLSEALTLELRARADSYEVWRHSVADPDPACAERNLTGRLPVGVPILAREDVLEGFAFAHLFTARGEQLGTVAVAHAVAAGDTLCLEREQITVELS